jgi:acetyl-CoA carboxylase carboxyltransferase component
MDVTAPISGTVVATASVGDRVDAGDRVVVLEAMKMEHVVTTEVGGRVARVDVTIGATVDRDAVLVGIEATTDADEPPTARPPDGADATPGGLDDDAHPLLDAVLDRHDRLEDARRPDAVERRSATGRRTARANLGDLVDAGSFTEYGPLAIAAQERRRDVEELIERTSTDGIITGLATVNAERFGPADAECAVMIYDYTVLAGTQGHRTHAKQDRVLQLAHRRRLPVIVFAEGGGGRPGDVDVPGFSHLDVPTFNLMARMSGRAPTIAVVSGYCFAGNAVLAATADVVIATEDSNLGAGGPAMIEGGGLGRHEPGEIGPIEDQVPAGVVDLRVDDEVAATKAARRYLGYFQGSRAGWRAPAQDRLRTLVPERRQQLYDMRSVIAALADEASTMELRAGFGPGIVTVLARVEGHPIGIVANDPSHLGGALDVDGTDKAARFLHLCEAYDLPVLVLCDTPGIMVGPDAERAGTLRHAARLMVAGANLTVPTGTVVVRKGYGLGAQAMAAGSFKGTDFTIAWPTGEFGGMNLEGAVRLGHRRELEAIDDEQERAEATEALIAAAYEQGRALRAAELFEIDAVIDPAETRTWVRSLTRAAGPPRWRSGDHRSHVDPW